MHRTQKLIAFGSLLLGLIAGAPLARASAIVNTGGPTCVPYGTAGFGDLDFKDNGTVQVKSGSDRYVMCGVTRNYYDGTDATVYFHAYGFNANGKHVSPALMITNTTGGFVATIYPTTAATSFGNGNFDMTFAVPASYLGPFNVTAGYVFLPASKNGGILGFAAP
jgi:hypothetical protein